MGRMDTMKETAAKTADAAKGATKATQDKLEEQKFKKKIGELKQELGGIVFAQKTGADNPASDATFDASIDRLVSEIEEQEAARAAVGAASAEESGDESGDASGDGSDGTPAPDGSTDAA